MDGSQWVLVHEFPTHGGYNHQAVTAAVRIEDRLSQRRAATWSISFPALARKDGRPIGAANADAALDGKNISAGPAIARRRTPG